MLKSINPNINNKSNAFTIVELLVVIVVIGMLAVIVIVSYTGVQSKAKIASLQSDLTGASQQLKLYQVTDVNGNYPTSLDGNNCFVPAGPQIVCLKASPDTTYTYSVNNTSNPKTFTLDATNGTLTYRITDNSTPNELIAAAFVCGSPLTINHTTANGVAPVDKTVNYGTVSTTLFGGTKCAITQNLGADNQATSATDATEASAGWYWQFNRKQGFKHDSTTRTPATAWISNITENSNWIAADDPCTIELGTGWRMPTYTEWLAADGVSGGNWTDYNSAFSSVLKLHAAGYLFSGTGVLANRGLAGYYYPSTQLNDSMGWQLRIGSSYSALYNLTKSFGFSLRCIKD